MSGNDFSNWLERKYLAWAAEGGRRRTLGEFAEWLDIPGSLVSRYLGGSRSPSKENMDKIAAKLGLEIYSLLGKQPPDSLLLDLQTHWNILSDEQRNQIYQILADAKSSK